MSSRAQSASASIFADYDTMMSRESEITGTKSSPLITPGGVLRRKCACGNHTVTGGSCSACAEKQGALQRRASVVEPANEIPPVVHEVLRSSGQPLDAATRAYMEPRFGHDFSNVRVHADPKAAQSAHAVDALAYTVGSHIVFGANQHAPYQSAGRELLAHELAHVVQQQHVTPGATVNNISQPNDPGETSADQLSHAALSNGSPSTPVTGSSSPVLSRRVIPRLVRCTASADGAPADPVAELTSIVDRAEAMVTATSILLTLNAALTRTGMRPVGSTVDQAFDDRFGEPPAVGRGFMNRLTGAVRPTLEIALAEEMELMARRYDLIANQLGSGFIHYRCMSTTASFGGCSIPDCSKDAWACAGVGAIFLCPGFWGGDTRTSSTLLIHETSHMIWENVIHGARGSGGNFRHAECYASLVADIFGIEAGLPTCPVP